MSGARAFGLSAREWAALRAPPPAPRPSTFADPCGGAAAVTANAAALDARRAFLFDNAASAGSKDKWRAAGNSYEAFCERVGLPPLEDGVIPRRMAFAWLDDKCDEADNAQSVGHWVSQLYAHYSKRGEAPAYDKARDGPFFRAARAALGKEYGTKVKQPPAVLAQRLRRVHDALQPERNPRLRALWVHIVAAYHWMLRPNEHVGGDCILRVKDVTIFRDAATGVRLARLHVQASKGLRRVHAAPGEYEVTFTRETEGPLDLIPMLERYIRDYGLAATPDAPLFPDLNRDGSLGTGYMSMDSFNSRLRELFAAAGLSTLPSARGLRSGRRTDLRNSGTPDDVVCQLGRWKSLSASWRYNRTDARIGARIPPANA